MMSTIDQEKAFDELTEVIQETAKNLNDVVCMTEKCSCCPADATSYLRIYLCDKHMKKYSDIKRYE